MNKLKNSLSGFSEHVVTQEVSVNLWCKITLLFVCFALCIPSAYSIPLQLYKTQSTDTCDLQCWLNSLVIHIPDQSFEELGFNITLSNIYCMNITFDGLDSYLVPPVGIDLYAYGLGLNCTMDWNYYQITFPSINGDGTAGAVINGSSVNVSMQLLVGSNGLAYAANLTSCDAKIHVAVTITGSVLADLLNIIINAIKGLLESELETVICDEVTSLVNNNMTAVLVEIDTQILPYLVTPTPAPAPPVPSSGMTNLMTSVMVTFIDDLVNNFLGPAAINNVVNFLTNNTGAINVNDLEYLNYTLNVAGVGNVTFGLVGINITDLNTWNLLQIFVPISKYSLTTKTGMEQLKLSLEFFVNVSLNNSPYPLYETGIFTADLRDNVLNSSAQAAFYSHPYKGLTLDQLSSVGCLLDGIYDLNLTLLTFNFSIAQLTVNATSGGTEEQLDNFINNVLALFVGAFMPVIPALFNGIIAGPVRNLVNEEFAAILASDEPCPPAGEVIPDTDWVSTSYATVGAATAFFAITLGVILLTRYKKKDKLKLVSSASEDKMVEAVPLLNDFASPILVKNEYTLIMDPAIPWVVRYLIPFAILANIVLFISSNTSNGASVYIVFEDQDGTVKLPSLFDFSLGNSVQDMWDAGVYPLSILIAVFSGAWPYMKLVMMLFCWLIPVKYLTVKRREYMLMFLDALGKWSLIDAFVLTLMMVAFHFDLEPEDGSSQAAIEAYVEPKWGFYSFLLSTMMSLTLSHIILALHNHAKGSPEINDPEKLPLYKTAFRSKSKWTRHGLTFLMVFLVIFALILVSVGSAIISFEFQFKGALELILEYLGQPTNQPYSIVTLGIGLPGSSQTPSKFLSISTLTLFTDSFGVRWIQVTFFMFSLVVPLLYLTTLLLLWLTPMTFKMQKRVFIITEVLNAWAALEVFVVSIIAALLEIQQFAAFIIGDKCDSIDQILEKYFSNQLDGDDTCFDVIATLESGCWLLFIACIIYVVVGSLVIRTTHKILTEREEMFIESMMITSGSAFPINKSSQNFVVQ